MTKKESLQLFEEKKVRTVWDDKEEKWYFSIVDVCGLLTEQPDTEHARNYWKVLKHRLVKEGNQTVTNCNRLTKRLSSVPIEGMTPRGHVNGTVSFQQYSSLNQRL